MPGGLRFILAFALLSWTRVFGSRILDSDPCLEDGHIVINDPHRSPHFQARSPSDLICDSNLVPAWYRFTVHGSSARIPTTCTASNHCGTQASIWHNITSNKACVTWSNSIDDGDDDCCSLKLSLETRQCDGFMLYFLEPTPGCNMAFCAEQDGTKDVTNGHVVRLTPDVTDSKFGLVCQIHPQPKLGLKSKFTWYKTDKQGLLTIVKALIVEGGRYLLLQKNHFSLGDSIMCEVEMVPPSHQPDLVSPILTSESYTVGIQLQHNIINISEGEQKTIVSVTTTAAHLCKGQWSNCKLTLAVKEKADPFRPSNVVIHPCFIVLDASTCNEENCGQGSFEVTVKGDYFFQEEPREIELVLELQSFSDPLWVGYEPKWVKLGIKDHRSSYCYATLSHVINEQDVQDVRQNVGLLYKDSDFQVYVQLRRCDPTAIFRCICGILAQDANEVIQITNCESHIARGRSTTQNDDLLEITYDNFGLGPRGMKILESRKGQAITVEFPSGPILRLHNKGDSGLAVSLKFQPRPNMTQGLCTPTAREMKYSTLKAVLDDIKVVNESRDYFVTSQPSIETNLEIHSRSCNSGIIRWIPLLFAIDMSHEITQSDSVFNHVTPLLTNGKRTHSKKEELKLLEPQGNGVTWKVKSRREVKKGNETKGRVLFAHRADAVVYKSGDLTSEEKVYKEKKKKDKLEIQKRKSRETRSKMFTMISDFYEEEIIPIIPEDNEESNELYGGYEPESKSKNFVSVNSDLNDMENSLALRCSALILDTPIVNECAEFLGGFVMKIVNFCVANYHRIMKTSSLPNLMAFLEDHCEAKVVENFGNYSVPGKVWDPPRDIKNAINCPFSCSGNGICLDFGCICDPGFFGDSCSKMDEKPPKLDGHSICDIGKGSCAEVKLGGSAFINTTELSCRLSVNGEHLEPIRAMYVNRKMIKCPIGKKATGVYELEVSNNLLTWSSSVQVTLVNSACQKCTYHGRKITCLERADVCTYEHTCIPHGSHNPVTPCLECVAIDGVREWRNICDNPCDPSPCFEDVACLVVGEGEKMVAKCGVCPPGMEGDGFECDDINDCASSPCYPGVECFDHAAPMIGFTCGPCPSGAKGDGITCFTGYSTKSPEIYRAPKKEDTLMTKKTDLDETVTKQAENEVKEKSEEKKGRKKKCLKKEGCRKKKVTVEANCASPCLNGGKCVGRNSCSCPSGYRGKYCEKSICNIQCQNGGWCIAPNVCRCMGGWTGVSCGAPICRPSCENGGTCIRPGVCSCKEGTTGPHCGIIFCSPACQNGGKCIGKNMCECPPGFTGKDCSISECSRNCVNGAGCVGDTCLCSPGYYGSDCEQYKCRRKCRHGGKCVGPDKCKCTKLFKGQFCQHQQKDSIVGKKKKLEFEKLLNLTRSRLIP